MTSLLLVLSLVGRAEPVDPFAEADESDLFRLDEQLVTVASRYEQTVRKAPSVVAVVTADDIRERGYRTLSELLRDLPGIYVWRSQEGRALAAFRGVVSSDNNKILVLIDGIPWYDGVYTHAPVDDYLPLAHVQQVEVIKGPGSAIYGTNAFAGVINVVTNRDEGASVQWTAGTGGLSDLTATGGLREEILGVQGRANLYARVSTSTGPGIDINPRGRRDILGDDPRESVNVGGSVQVGALSVQVHHVDHRHAYLVSEADDPWDLLGKDPDVFGLYYRDTLADVRWRQPVGRDVVLTPYAWLQHHDDPGSYFYLSGYTTEEVEDGVLETEPHYTTVETEKDTTRWSVGLEAEAHPGVDHVTVGGAGVHTTRVDSVVDLSYVDGSHDPEPLSFYIDTQDGPVAIRDMFAFIQHTWTASNFLELTGGLRLDRRLSVAGYSSQDQAWFRNFSPRLGVLVVPTDRTTLKLLYGRAFRAGNARELLVVADPDGDWSAGNTKLHPEHIHTAEIELSTGAGPADVTLTGVWSTVGDEIDKTRSESSEGDPIYQYESLDGALRVLSAEIAVDLDLHALHATAAYALTDATYQGGVYDGRRQYEFPPHMGKLRATWSPTDWAHATLLTEAYGSRPRLDWAPTTKLPDGDPFALVHASVWVERGDLGLGLVGRNLLDTTWGTGSYRDDADVGEPGLPKYPYEIAGAGREVRVVLRASL